jgi:Flp pilus assembly protein TadB
MATQYPDDTSSDADQLRERSLPELLKRLSEETTRLVHQELDLAKAELQAKGRQAGQGAGMFGAAGALGLAALGALTACFVLALNAVMPAWLAALIVTVVYAVIALVLVRQGQARVKAAAPPMPEQTVETLKEDVEWAKTQARSARR